MTIPAAPPLAMLRFPGSPAGRPAVPRRTRRTVRLAAALLAAVAPLAWSGAAVAQAARPTVAVPEFKNTVTPQTWWWQGPVARELADALANELQATGDLQVVERTNVKAVLSEQEMAELGIVRPDGDAARKGQMRGARYLVLGTVTSYDSNVEQKGSGSNFGLMGYGKNQQQVETKDYVAIDVRVVDSTTGEVVGSRTVEGRASSTAEARESGFSLLPVAGAALLLAPNMGRTGQVLTGAAGTLRFGNESTEVQRTPAAKALRAALAEASDYVSCVLVPRGNCLARFEAREQQRRERTRGVLQLD
ncbi:MAG: CsgG/HfaB family protein [Synechococcaceae cyanobacterium]|nr:CsgG/HfaB family protein [Synechococcaceae cyanobacterium]